MVWEPTERVLVMKAAEPVVETAWEARRLVPSRNSMRPVGEPVWVVSWAVKVTLCPSWAGLRELVRVSEMPQSLLVEGYS